MKRSYLLTTMISAATLGLATALLAGTETDSKTVKGAVEIDALKATHSKRLQKFDTDDDGNVSREEFREIVSSREKGLAVDLDVENLIINGMEDADIKRVRAIKNVMESGVEDGLSAFAPHAQGRIYIHKGEGDDDAEVDIDLDFDSGRRWHKRGAHAWSGLDRDEWFDIVDANEDGVLDRDEVAGARERIRDHGIDQRFDMLDTNKDGQLNDEDIEKRLEKLRALDADGDGAVSRREVGDLMRLLGKNPMHDQVQVMRMRRHDGYR